MTEIKVEWMLLNKRSTEVKINAEVKIKSTYDFS